MSTGSFGRVIQTALIHASVHPSSRADCPLNPTRLRWQSGFSDLDVAYSMANTALRTVPMSLQPLLDTGER